MLSHGDKTVINGDEMAIIDGNLKIITQHLFSLRKIDSKGKVLMFIRYNLNKL